MNVGGLRIYTQCILSSILEFCSFELVNKISLQQKAERISKDTAKAANRVSTDPLRISIRMLKKNNLAFQDLPKHIFLPVGGTIWDVPADKVSLHGMAGIALKLDFTKIQSQHCWGLPNLILDTRGRLLSVKVEHCDVKNCSLDEISKTDGMGGLANLSSPNKIQNHQIWGPCQSPRATSS